MQNEIKIVIADDHGLIREGLRQVIESGTDFKILEAENGKKALELIKNEKPLIAVLDIEMPEMTGFDVAKAVQSESIPVHLIFLTMFKEEAIFNKAMDMGVKGYVLKENTVTEIIKSIHSVLKGNYYLSPAISDFLMRRNLKPVENISNIHGLDKLTSTEKKVLKYVGAMKTSQEIADALFVSIKTIQNHRNNICNKLGLKGAHALLKFAVDHKDNI